MITAIIFIVVIGVLVLVHEFGHFIFAKRAGMKVEEFGFGFPPRLFGWKKGETTYSLNWIPFGGFVKIYGEDSDVTAPRSFSAGSFGNKIMVIVAGVMMNIILAAVLLIIVNFFGLRIGLNDKDFHGATDIKVNIIEVAANSPASQAGLSALDEIKGFTINGQFVAVTTTEEVQKIIKDNAGRSVTILIARGTEEIEKTVTPRLNPPEGQGALGVSMALTGVVTYPWYEAIWRGLYDTYILLVNILFGYWGLIATLVSKGKLMAEVSGPIGIATLTGQAARVGVNYLLQFVAMISINLAILNIIPFPALDGGRALVLIVEKIKGSPVHKRSEALVNMIGFYALVALMIYITVKDISHLLYK